MAEPTTATTATADSGQLTGRTALVTGAAQGLGAAITRRLRAAGADVIAVDVAAGPLALVAEETGSQALVLDLSDPSKVADALGEAASRVDILVNNAGIQHVARIEEFPLERFLFIHALMLHTPFALIKAVLPGMYSREWGRVVNISSAHGLRASPFKVAYVSAKHGLEGLSKVVALEGAPHGVTSNCINPGYVRTGLVEKQITDQAREHNMAPERVLAEVILANAAVKRLIDPPEVAEAVAFLCGPASASITGSSLAMDGGWTAR